MLVFVVAIGGAAMLLVSTVRSSVEDEIRADSARAIERVKARLEAGESPESVALPVTVDFYVLDGHGELLAGRPWTGSNGPSVYQDPDDGEVRIAMPGDPEPIVVYDRVRTTVGTVTLIAASPLEEVNRSVNALAKALWLSIPGLVVGVGLVAWWFVGRALRPVYAMRTALTEMNAASMHRRVPEPGTGDELDELARTMNSLLDRLEHASEHQHRFVSDASHELRSPVASIRATVEVAQHRGADTDWPDVARRVLADDARLEQMVDELLELARLDESDAPIPDVLVDVDDLVLDEAGRLRTRVAVLTDRVSAGRVRGTRSQLERVVRNLGDNAARHARSTVALTLHTHESVVELSVDDDGPGIPAEDHERVFERFTRLEDGRGRDAGGAGLGLAMVRAIVERHGGTVHAGVSQRLGGARLVVTLPAGETVSHDGNDQDSEDTTGADGESLDA
ncbi:MAG TPA: HAMP domain-containing sensor histidine kinase [Acidimicrobiia bacterium]|nr:HAMP domain-containing sensor histidine kinase [Acidimicrobiia bacterium]